MNPKAAVAALSAAFFLAGCGGMIAKSPDDPYIQAGIKTSLKAEIAEAGKPLPVGKAFVWDSGTASSQWGNARVVSINERGCYDLRVRVVSEGQPNERANDYLTGEISICP